MSKIINYVMNDFDFLKLYMIVSLGNGNNLIEKNLLEKSLYRFIDDEDYIPILKNIQSDDEKVLLDNAFNSSYAYNYLIKTSDFNKDKISISSPVASSIKRSFTIDQIELMNRLYASTCKDQDYQFMKRKQQK